MVKVFNHVIHFTTSYKLTFPYKIIVVYIDSMKCFLNS